MNRVNRGGKVNRVGVNRVGVNRVGHVNQAGVNHVNRADVNHVNRVGVNHVIRTGVNHVIRTRSGHTNVSLTDRAGSQVNGPLAASAGVGPPG